jgi:hypothetical protein
MGTLHMIQIYSGVAQKTKSAQMKNTYGLMTLYLGIDGDRVQIELFMMKWFQIHYILTFLFKLPMVSVSIDMRILRRSCQITVD